MISKSLENRFKFFGGFSNSIPYDNFANEEYWGIVTRDRVPKEAYYVVQEIYEAASLSVNENFLDISVYPNPVSDGFLNVINPSNEALNISVYDLNGRMVHSQQIIFDSIDISHLSGGFYSMLITSGKRTTAKKIVVK